MKVKEESEKVGFKLNVQKTKKQQILELIKRENIQFELDPIKEYPGLLTVDCTCHQ